MNQGTRLARGIHTISSINLAKSILLGLVLVVLTTSSGMAEGDPAPSDASEGSRCEASSGRASETTSAPAELRPA